MTFDATEALRVALAPNAIGVIGASENPHKIGGRPIAYLSRFGFKGRIVPVNPARTEVQGLPCFRSLADAPEVPDMVIVAVPGELAVEAVGECARLGVKVCIIMSSGFGEVHEAGKVQERAMRDMALRAGMRLFGPNSQGLANFGNGTVASFSTMFTEVAPQDGPLGIISQSGAMSVIPYGLLRQRGLGVRHSHATGNDCDVTVCELAAVVAEDPHLRLLMLYLEGIPDPWNLARAARTARERNLPIVVLKAGRTPAGQVAASSHTGSLASEDKVVDAFLEEHGIFRAQSMADMIATAPLYLQGWRPRGRRLVALSNSGAVCVLAADAATQENMPLDELQPNTQTELRGILPGFATVRNPVDITAALLTNSSLFSKVLPALARDPAADAFMVGIAVAGAGYDVDVFARDSAVFAQQTGKPLVVAAPQESVALKFREHGLVTYATEGEAIGALGRYLTHAQRMEHATRRQPRIPGPPAPPRDGEMLDEARSLALLARHGLPVVAHRLCRDAADVRAAWLQLGARRVVVKGCTPDASHKTELGLVHVGVADAEGAQAASEAIAKAAFLGGVRLNGFIVAEMVQSGLELMIGARIDPVFGPVLLVGAGGKYVEAMPDMALLMAPCSAADVAAALERLRIAPLLHGTRGEPPLDVAAFCAAAVAVGDAVSNPSLNLSQVDVNPVFVRRLGEGCTAVDAVVFQTTPHGTDPIPTPQEILTEEPAC
ncbi:acetate--CoA ligase family protein [Hydrogenophaga sp.]|uniref:acetate--CoA ligase family protein n=1 Tax=Hydrogenophaga sp. TaxID=1904254 RepID=UPI00271C2681|nr:acetate--CoA ligase family protein [Hydrogenophaga sp.]MDO9436554.1 acetate--CoA ligase family protein [Hydrogenophaga sp.]